MRIPRLQHEQGAVVDFYRDALEHLGALCERTWYDRLQVVAEGRAARLWREEGDLTETELSFPPPETSVPRDTTREVFPGCPLTFNLFEALRPSPLPLERVVLATEHAERPPDGWAEKTWRAQFPNTARWRLVTPFAATHHFSLIGLVRCEIQAIDQHWSLHRLAWSIPDGTLDPDLVSGLALAETTTVGSGQIDWPAIEPDTWSAWFQAGLKTELATELAAVRARQERFLSRELKRIDEYFDRYEKELTARTARSRSKDTREKLDQRLAATRVDHQRRRSDQVERHQIRVAPHVDALLLTAERAWEAKLEVLRDHSVDVVDALLAPRTRRWVVKPATG